MKQPRGFSLLEMAVAGVLMAILLSLCLKMLSATAIERQSVEKRLLAMQEAANLIERIAALPSNELTPERLALLQQTSAAPQILPGGVAQVSLESDQPDAQARQVRVEIRWGIRPEDAEAPVSLSYWPPGPRGGPSP